MYGFKKVQNDFSDDIHILGMVVFSYPAIILIKNSIQNPMKVVLHVPVRTHRFCGKISIYQRCQTKIPKNILYLQIHRMRFVCAFLPFQSHLNLSILPYLQAIINLCGCDIPFFLSGYGLFPSRIEDSESCNVGCIFHQVHDWRSLFLHHVFFFLVSFQGKR